MMDDACDGVLRPLASGCRTTFTNFNVVLRTTHAPLASIREPPRQPPMPPPSVSCHGKCFFIKSVATKAMHQDVHLTVGLYRPLGTVAVGRLKLLAFLDQQQNTYVGCQLVVTGRKKIMLVTDQFPTNRKKKFDSVNTCTFAQ